MNIYIYIIICIKLEAVHSTSKDILISKFHGNQKTNASCYTKIKSSHLILWISDESSATLKFQIGWYIYMWTISLSAPYNKYQDEPFFCALQRNEQNHNTLDYSGDGEKWLVCNVKTPNSGLSTDTLFVRRFRMNSIRISFMNPQNVIPWEFKSTSRTGWVQINIEQNRSVYLNLYRFSSFSKFSSQTDRHV